jgi:EAL and modified HD-GYP domain-containing signal transduction protein
VSVEGPRQGGGRFPPYGFPRPPVSLSSPTPPPRAVAQDVHLARQPIFDTGDRCVAYELLYRASSGVTAAEGLPEAAMSSHTALHAMVSIGLDRLTGGVPAWVNIGREHLVGDLYRVFRPGDVVLELLETIEPDDAVVQATQRAVAAGYTVALDDFEMKPTWAPLLPLARVVKVDVLGHDATSLARFIAPLRAHPQLTLLAERVETAAMRATCGDLGFRLFQGYYFRRPETIGGRALSLQQVAIANLLGLLGDPGVPDGRLEDAFRSQPALSYLLLRIVNSASLGLRDVQSIAHAIRLLGRAALSRWLLILLVSGVASRGPVAHEAVTHALARARFCELVTDLTGSGDAAARFLVGLLSRFDVLLGEPMSEVLARLPVSAEVRDALLDGTGPHASVLRLVEAYEQAAWDAVAAQGGGPGLGEAYADAVSWARERLSATGA